MGAEDKGNFAGKHQPGEQPDDTLANEIKKETKENALACAVAFKIAETLGVPAADVGKAADLLNYPLIKCQLGLFGYAEKPNRKIVKAQPAPDPGISAAITEALSNGRLPCHTAWEIAERFNVAKLTVSGISESMGIKIKPCQLGAF